MRTNGILIQSQNRFICMYIYINTYDIYILVYINFYTKGGTPVYLRNAFLHKAENLKSKKEKKTLRDLNLVN